MTTKLPDFACSSPVIWRESLWPDRPGAVWSRPAENGQASGCGHVWPDMPGAVWARPADKKPPRPPGRNDLPTDHPAERAPHGRKPHVPPVGEPGEPIPQRMPGRSPPGRRAAACIPLHAFFPEPS